MTTSSQRLLALASATALVASLLVATGASAQSIDAKAKKPPAKEKPPVFSGPFVGAPAPSPSGVKAGQEGKKPASQLAPTTAPAR